MVKLTVKARERHGTTSLDLTLPADLVKKCSINKGDIFQVESDNEGNLKIIYTLVFKNE